ncbi:hypothetical protein N7532_006436 [Penicillium argentinense]|uniref:Uncharacterized protein n=1 Tax=Penicillium argentinense TaxID=1131581 RepID=A0A9W9KAU8_9EURO|nr:uncharacterized protein N7532_006436 [Penicillium argentinense]KAJ5099435.1 hypothetical protein N7532_006436 [Penicillium argentinense]
MAVEALAVIVPSHTNGTNGVNGVNRVNGDVGHNNMPVALLLEALQRLLVDSKTIGMLSKKFSLDNFINKHAVHKKVITNIDIDKVNVENENDAFLDTMIDLKVQKD